LETMSRDKPTIEFYHHKRAKWVEKIEGAEEK